MSKGISFSLTEKQEKQVKSWYKTLIKKHPKIFKKEENRFPVISYIFTPTGIGHGVEIYEMHTKERKDITDYGSW